MEIFYYLNKESRGTLTMGVCQQYSCCWLGATTMRPRLLLERPDIQSPPSEDASEQLSCIPRRPTAVLRRGGSAQWSLHHRTTSHVQHHNNHSSIHPLNCAYFHLPIRVDKDITVHTLTINSSHGATTRQPFKPILATLVILAILATRQQTSPR
ncbi:hypothetical protein A9K55_000301 [Cordyceps militaris]|uniref:Uncharacterized protein n=1 Tax=Cordyceps militaris TaxID=73501 RepID=A0A2H4SW11_CORMI|nr:hypothetical protein A9K55_000301 [Cordyceps militaris]